MCPRPTEEDAPTPCEQPDVYCEVENKIADVATISEIHGSGPEGWADSDQNADKQDEGEQDDQAPTHNSNQPWYMNPPKRPNTTQK